MPVYGASLLSLSLSFAVLTIFLIVLFLRRDDDRFFFVAQRTSLGVCFLVTLATVTLLASLLKSDFDVDYVAKYTSLGTPTLYKFTAMWAGQSGSVRFLLFFLCYYSDVVMIKNRIRH